MKSVDTAILFDLDGTLVDTVYAHVVAWSDALRRVGIVVPDWKIHRRIGMSGASLIHQILREDQKLPRKADIGLLEKRHDSGFTKASRNLQVLPGSEELLRFLTRRGIRWAIATTGGRKATARLLKKLKIPSTVPVVTGDDVAKAKPSPDVFMLAADRLGVPHRRLHCDGRQYLGCPCGSSQTRARGRSSLGWLRSGRAGEGGGLPSLYRSGGHVASYRGSGDRTRVIGDFRLRV